MNELGNAKAAAHRDRANKYRQTPWPAHEVPKVPVPATDTEYPKAVKCLDGATRIAEDEEHHESLLSQQMDAAPAAPAVEPEETVLPEHVAFAESVSKAAEIANAGEIQTGAQS